MPRASFAAQVGWLAGHGYHAVTLQQVFDSWRGAGTLPPRPVVLSFDDGYLSQVTNALPVLKARKWPGVLNLEYRNLKPVWGIRPPGVRKLLAAGWELDAHTLTHPDLTTVGRRAPARGGGRVARGDPQALPRPGQLLLLPGRPLRRRRDRGRPGRPATWARPRRGTGSPSRASSTRSHASASTAATASRRSRPSSRPSLREDASAVVARRPRRRARPPRRRRGLAYYLYVQGKGRDIRGSSTVEFVPTEPAPTPPAPKPQPEARHARLSGPLTRVDWPTFGYDGRRLRYLPSPLRPPFRVEWTFRAHHLIEFPPAVAYGRVYVANNPGTLFAVSAKTGRLGWRFASGRCTAASPAVANGLVYEAFLNKAAVQPEAGLPGDRRRDRRPRRADRGRASGGTGSGRASPRRSSPRAGSTSATGTAGSTPSTRRPGASVWRFRTGGEVKGALALSGRRAVRRLVRPPPVRPRRRARGG